VQGSLELDCGLEAGCGENTAPAEALDGGEQVSGLIRAGRVHGPVAETETREPGIAPLDSAAKEIEIASEPVADPLETDAELVEAQGQGRLEVVGELLVRERRGESLPAPPRRLGIRVDRCEREPGLGAHGADYTLYAFAPMEPSRDDTIRRVSLVDDVTERLRSALLIGEIQPGERIRVTELEKRFGVSHIPIREALRRLESEGLVVRLPQRAAVAAGVALDDLEGLYDLRRLIEGQVARRAVERMTDDDLARIREAAEALEGAADDPDSPAFWQLHSEFHWVILQPGGSDWIRRVLDQLWQAAERYVRLFVSTFGPVDDALSQHRGLVAACEARDADALYERLIEHLDLTERTVREGYLQLSHGADEPAPVGRRAG
jgi:DNA-binding GntR family transcriptional regulator